MARRFSKSSKKLHDSCKILEFEIRGCFFGTKTQKTRLKQIYALQKVWMTFKILITFEGEILQIPETV